MIIILKESEVYINDPYSKEDAEATIKEYLESIFTIDDNRVVDSEGNIKLNEIKNLNVIIIKDE